MMGKSKTSAPDSLPYAALFLVLLGCSRAGDSITAKAPIVDVEGGETLVSAGKVFELGFFTPVCAPENRRYVGIWYFNQTSRTVVWVANRDRPVPGREGTFSITERGKLQVFKDGNTYWSKGTASTEARLHDSGNLKLVSGRDPWESFSEPTDVLLPGMDMGEGFELKSWKNPEGPSPGEFGFKQRADGNGYEITKDGYPYRQSGESGEEFLNRDTRMSVPHLVYSLTSNNDSAWAGVDITRIHSIR